MLEELPAGRYIIAVSGGVDSVSLLHMLAQQRNQRADVELIVAHLDHGIREDSSLDREFVQNLAKKYGLAFVHHKVDLGVGAGEAKARKVRYDFLHETKRVTGARAVITAHHEDDVLETIILNLLRGTSSRGLSSLRSSDIVMRPLLHVSKRQLETYAKLHRLQWAEDKTNQDTNYLRNYIRLNIIPKLGRTGRTQLLRISNRARELNDQIEAHAQRYLHTQPHVNRLDRVAFQKLPREVAREVLAEWLRLRTAYDIELSSKMLERLVDSCNSATNGSLADISKGWSLKMSRHEISLIAPLEKK